MHQRQNAEKPYAGKRAHLVLGCGGARGFEEQRGFAVRLDEGEAHAHGGDVGGGVHELGIRMYLNNSL